VAGAHSAGNFEGFVEHLEGTVATLIANGQVVQIADEETQALNPDIAGAIHRLQYHDLFSEVSNLMWNDHERRFWYLNGSF
jgi:hypothetical protein